MPAELGTEFYSTIDSLGERVQKIPEPPKAVVFVSELPVGSKLLDLIRSFKLPDKKIEGKYGGEFETTETWKDIDGVLIKVAKDTEIDETNKSKLFKLLRIYSHDFLAVRIAKSMDPSLKLSESIQQPVTASYITNREKARSFFQELRVIRKTIGAEAHNLIYSGYEQLKDTPLGGITLEQREVILKRIKAFNPSSKEESSGVEIVKHFNGELLDPEQEILSKLQYLRLIKEKINFMIADNNDSFVLLEEQEADSQLANIRIGDNTTVERVQKTRRHSLLSNIHYGTTLVQTGEESQGRNFLGMDPDFLSYIKELKSSLKTNDEISEVMDSFAEESKNRIEWLKSHKGELITSEDGLNITKRFLTKMGLASSDSDSTRQIEDYQTNQPTPDIKTLTAAIINTAGLFSFEPRNNLIIEPGGKEPSRLDGSMETLLHEITHALQSVRRQNSPVGLMTSLKGFGRSLILAEMGAMHNEAMIQSLFGEINEYWSDYEYEILLGYLEGKTFMQLIQIALKPIYENDSEVTRVPKDLYFDPITKIDLSEANQSLGVNKKRYKAANVAIRRVFRLYRDLGATGDGENPTIKKYPNTWSMAYLLGLFSKYTQYPSTLSGVPTHRIEELKDLLPDFYIGDEKVTDSMIIRIFIDSAYEVMKAKLEQPAASV